MAGATVNRGFAWPLRVDGRGGIATASGNDAVRLAVLALLGTHPGERVMRPEYGCPLRSLVFAPNTPATANLARFYVETALARWEPRVKVESVAAVNRVSSDGPYLWMEVRYRIVADARLQSVEFELPLG